MARRSNTTEPMTDTQRLAKRLRSQSQAQRLKDEVEATRRERAAQPPVPEIVAPLVRPARPDEQFDASTFCGQPIRVTRVQPQEPQP